MRKILQSYIMLAIIYCCTMFSQNILSSNEVVQINNKSITTDEFLERFEMSPHFRQSIKRNTSSTKLEFLYTLITEKLWASEAVTMGLDTTESIRTSIEAIEKLYVRHALFEKEIREKIIIPEEKFIESVIRNSIIYFTKYIYSIDSANVANAYQSLISGIPFDTLIKSRDEHSTQKEPKEVYFGDLVEHIEEPLFSLDIGEFTKPLKADDGWYIFYVYNKKEQLFNTKEEEQNANTSVRKILKNRLGEQIQNKFYRDFFSDKKIDVNRKLFSLLSQKLSDIFKTKNQVRSNISTTLLTLDAYDILKLRNQLGKVNLKKNFIEFESAPVSLNNFLNNLVFDGFQIKQPSQVTQYLNTRVRMFIEHELLAREGYKKNLQELPEVKKYVGMWKDYYLSQSFLSNQIEKEIISDEQAKKYYNKKFRKPIYSETNKQMGKIEQQSKTFEQIKNSLKRELAYAKQYNKLVNSTAMFANNSFIKINPNAINKIDVTNINSFAFRVLGFGGKITAVPIIKPFTDWVKKWISKDNILP